MGDSQDRDPLPRGSIPVPSPFPANPKGPLTERELFDVLPTDHHGEHARFRAFFPLPVISVHRNRQESGPRRPGGFVMDKAGVPAL